MLSNANARECKAMLTFDIAANVQMFGKKVKCQQGDGQQLKIYFFGEYNFIEEAINFKNIRYISG